MQLTECRLSDLSNLKYKFYTCPFERDLNRHALIAAFDGAYGFGSKGNGDAHFMSVIVEAGLAAWRPDGLILDLTTMSYEWGDMIGLPMEGHAIPTTVVVSDLNREGLTSFIRQEMDEDPSKWLFDTLAGALESVEDQSRKSQIG